MCFNEYGNNLYMIAQKGTQDQMGIVWSVDWGAGTILWVGLLMNINSDAILSSLTNKTTKQLHTPIEHSQ